MRFSNQVVIVTGAGRGIGQAVAQAYADEGANVVIVDRDNDAAHAAARNVMHVNGRQPLVQVVDVSDPSGVSTVVKQVEKVFGRIHVLINNAGFGIWKSPLELQVSEWDSVLNTNLRAAFLLAREVAPVMKGSGAIVNIASTRATMSEPNSEAYAASKGGLLALTHALAVSFASLRIRVNAISPGWIETGDYSQLRAVDHEQHPSMRVGRPADIARACLFLTDPANDFITGENLVIDGGMTRKMIYEP